MNSNTPAFCGTPREYVISITYVLYGGNCTDAVSIVNSNDWERFHNMLAWKVQYLHIVFSAGTLTTLKSVKANRIYRLVITGRDVFILCHRN
jgi:hypothetical protein